jgi:hypothetical protein
MITVGQIWRRRVELHDGWDRQIIVGREVRSGTDVWVTRALDDAAGESLEVAPYLADVIARDFTLLADAPAPAEGFQVGEWVG